MNMTLFCDASYCPETRATGWGAWAIRDGWSGGRTFGGRVTPEILSSSEAEISAIAEAMRVLGDGEHLAGTELLFLQSDCIRTLGTIALAVPQARISDHPQGAKVKRRRSDSGLSDREKAALATIVAIQQQHGLSICVRHVRGHRQGHGRQWANRECDRIAREHMQADRLRVAA